jgi:hypothetical protein
VVIFCNWATPGAELLFLGLDFWALDGTGVTPNRIISTKDASGLIRVSFDERMTGKPIMITGDIDALVGGGD